MVIAETSIASRPARAVRTDPVRLAAKPVLLVISFHIDPRGHKAWHDNWRHIHAAARKSGACRQFHIGRSRQGEGEFILVSVWDSADDVARFVRESGLLWFERSVEHFHHRPARYSVFEITQVDPSRG
jgi:quinol monooxygenase YgiN